LEKQVLGEILRREGQIIATGGGIVLDEENLSLLKEKAFLVSLTAGIDTLLKRAGNHAKRPLLKGMHRKERIESLLRQREKYYAQAHAAIDTTDLTIEQVIEKIVNLVNVER
jgi:shikimate kinase